MRHNIYDALRVGNLKRAAELIEEWHAVHPHPALERAYLICLDGLEFNRGFSASVAAWAEVKKA